MTDETLIPPKTVTVHTCKLGLQISEISIPKNNINYINEVRYVWVGTINGRNEYRPIEKCGCKKKIDKFQANEQTNYGNAKEVYKVKGGELETVDDAVWANFWTEEKSKVPRIDLTTRADIERAFISKRKSSKRTIEEVHLMYMENRAKLIVPFRLDPYDIPCSHPNKTDGFRCKRCAQLSGQAVLTFFTDMRTDTGQPDV